MWRAPGPQSAAKQCTSHVRPRRRASLLTAVRSAPGSAKSTSGENRTKVHSPVSYLCLPNHASYTNCCIHAPYLAADRLQGATQILVSLFDGLNPIMH